MEMQCNIVLNKETTDVLMHFTSNINLQSIIKTAIKVQSASPGPVMDLLCEPHKSRLVNIN